MYYQIKLMLFLLYPNLNLVLFSKYHFEHHIFINLKLFVNYHDLQLNK